jgi:SAM-dependent methyltransferase
VSAISAIAYGFMGSQALFAALELGVFDALANEPSDFDALAANVNAPVGPLRVLLSTCLALKLLTREGERYANSPAAARFLVRASRSYVGDYYLRQTSPITYPEMPKVRALLRGEPVGRFDYTTVYTSPEKTEEFIRGQHAGSLGPAILLTRTYDFAGCSRLLDLGGGSGAFAIETVKRYPDMSAVVLDLPAVIAVTERIIAEAGLVDKITCVGGDLRSAPWPPGADAILLSYIVSCYAPQTLHDLMARTFAYLPAGGRLLVHDFALYADRSGPHNAALFLFGELSGLAETTAYTVDELAAAMRAAGYVDVASRPFLPDITFLVTGRKP